MHGTHSISACLALLCLMTAELTTTEASGLSLAQLS